MKRSKKIQNFSSKSIFNFFNYEFIFRNFISTIKKKFMKSPFPTIINIWIYSKITHINRLFDLYFNFCVRSQIKKTTEIPIIIINYNQLFYLEQSEI